MYGDWMTGNTSACAIYLQIFSPRPSAAKREDNISHIYTKLACETDAVDMKTGNET